MTQTNDVSQMSTQELKELLARKEKQEREARIKKRENYERRRDHMVRNMVTEAGILQGIMSKFKAATMLKLEEFSKEAHLYGQIKKHSKGGFSLRTTDGQMMVRYERNTSPEYDERAGMAEELLKEFLEDKVKKRDKKAFIMVTNLLSRDKEGRYYPSRINGLLKIRDLYADERWQKAMQLFEESYRNRLVSYTVTFHVKDEMEKDKAIILTFASIPVLPGAEEDFSMKELVEEMA